jgi:hypothetical protein
MGRSQRLVSSEVKSDVRKCGTRLLGGPCEVTNEKGWSGDSMKVTRWILSVGVVIATFGQANAGQNLTENEKLLAPTVVQASCDVGTSCSNVCDGATSCDSGLCGCGAGCDSSGCDGLCGCDDGLLGFGLIKHSERCFNDFISPMTNPVFFEDPRTLSEVRFIFLNHNLPDSLGGNSLQVYAMQVRAAITERLSIIATKDGFIYTQSPVLESGFADINAGLKYNLYRDVCKGRLLSIGSTFEVPTGSNKSLQGNGNGELNLFVSGGTRIGEKAHWISASGLRQPMDTNLENSLFYFSNHLDRQIGSRPLYAFTELNVYNFQTSGTAFPLAVEGGDLFNLGSPNISGNNLVTNAIGLKAKPRANMETGIAYEYNLADREGLLKDRLTLDWIIRY